MLWDAAVIDFDVTNPGTVAVSRTITTPLGLQTIANLSAGWFGGTTVTDGAAFTSLDISDQTPQAGGTAALTGFSTISSVNSSAWSLTTHTVRTNTSSQIRTRLQTSGAADHIGCVTRGWDYPPI